MSDDMRKAIDDARRRLSDENNAAAEQKKAYDAQQREAEAVGTQLLLEFISKMRQLGVQPRPARTVHTRTTEIELWSRRPKTKTLEDTLWGSGWFAWRLFVTTDARLYVSHHYSSGDSVKNRFGFSVRSSEERTSWTSLPNSTTIYGERRDYDPGYSPPIPLIVAETLNHAVGAEIERQANGLGPL